MNAHHPMWESVINGNVTGNNLVNVLFKSPDINVTTPKALSTYINLNNFCSSTLDLYFTSSELYLNSKVTTSDDFGSDHELNQISFFSKPNIQQIKTRPKWKFKERPDCEKWRKNLP